MTTASAPLPPSPSDLDEKPRNGLRGLRHIKYDLPAGLVVSLVSLPLSSGIAIASGAPPIYGIISAIIAGLVFPLVGGAYVTISGPAAGLAPALVVTMAALGGVGDADHVGAGYPLLLVVIFSVGILQLILSKLGLARFCAIFPVSVVEGMLAAIGVLIIVKSLPMFFGYTGATHPHGFGEYITSTPEYLAQGNTTAALIAAGCLVLMLGLGSSRLRLRGIWGLVPPQLTAVAIGAALAVAFRSALPDVLFISVPADPFSGLQLPAFGEMLRRADLWQAAIIGVITLTLIDGVESLATALAIDRVDPFGRRSQPNRVLAAMGLSNILSSLVGGLTIIPGGVKSKTNIAAGGRTLWANFFNAMCLLAFLFVAPGLIALIPKAVLGAVLVYTGWKMCHPAIARRLAEVGPEQVVLYGFTIVVTLATDLLWGIAAGTALELAMDAWTNARVVWSRRSVGGDASMRPALAGMFRSPVIARVLDGGTYRIELGGPVVSSNAFHLAPELEQLPAGTERVQLVLGSGVTMVDHTACDIVLSLVEAHGRRLPVELRGLDDLCPVSTHAKAVRLGLARDPRTGVVLDSGRPRWSEALVATTAGFAAMFGVVEIDDATAEDPDSEARVESRVLEDDRDDA